MQHRSGQCGGSRQERSKGDSDDNSNNLANYPVLRANQAQPSRAYGTGKLANKALEVLVGSWLLAAGVCPYLKPSSEWEPGLHQGNYTCCEARGFPGVAAPS